MKLNKKYINFFIVGIAVASTIFMSCIYGAYEAQIRKNEQLFSAARNGISSAIKMLVNANADVNYGPSSKRGDTPLIVASYYGHSKTVQALLKAQADVNQQNDKYETALKCAVEGVLEENKKKVVSEWGKITAFLLDARANISQYVGGGDTVFTLSLKSKHWPLIKALVSVAACHGTIDMQGGNDVRDNPLMCAVRVNNLEATRRLLEFKASPNIQNSFNGKTALMLAVWHGAGHDILKALLEAEADINIRDKYGDTALTLAMRHPCNRKAARMLISKAFEEFSFPAVILPILIDYIVPLEEN